MNVPAFFTLNSHSVTIHEVPWLWPLSFVVTVSLLYLFGLHMKLSKSQYNNSAYSMQAQTSVFEFLRNRHRVLEWQT